jgi:hypothetical protein
MGAPRTRWLRLRLLVARAALSMLYSAVLVGLAVATVFLTTEPPLLSYLLEPVSLLLLPGLMVSLMAAGAHDFNASTVLYASFVWYIVFFYLLLTWRYRRKARLIPGSEL